MPKCAFSLSSGFLSFFSSALLKNHTVDSFCDRATKRMVDNLSTCCISCI